MNGGNRKSYRSGGIFVDCLDERLLKFLRMTRNHATLEGDVFKRGVKIVSGHGSRQIPLKGNLLIIIGLLTHLAGLPDRCLLPHSGGRANDFTERNFIAGEITRTRVTRPLRARPAMKQDP